MTQLIVALDLLDAKANSALARRLASKAGVRFFKIDVRVLFHKYGLNLIDDILGFGPLPCHLFFDMKSYQTKDTTAVLAKCAFDAGVSCLSVHATPSMLEAAMAAKTSDYCKVLAIGDLTDNASFHSSSIAALLHADGLICRVDAVPAARKAAPSSIIVCPGIRPEGSLANNHINPATPSMARVVGADYIVVGRPIYEAPDPVIAAKLIMEEFQYESLPRSI